MLIKRKPDLNYSDVTPKDLYVRRRQFLTGMGVLGAALAGRAAWRWVQLMDAHAGTKLDGVVKGPFGTDEEHTPYKDATTYNNYYEFGTGKGDPAMNSRDFRTSPWAVSVEGEVKKPRKFDMAEILKLAPLEERIYRLRCVEAWSMVIPWIGYPFSALANLVEPTPKAKYVAFETYYGTSQMPQGRYAGIDFPYVEGLRLDEAMHPLTILCVGMYGETLPNQNGAPVRIIVPWKYGFKSIKSLVRIRFVKNEPPITWSLANPSEYGFYSNVNPNVDHPRWSQARERRIGEFLKRPTQMFNGYGEQVASLYSGMDLKRFY
ncbi:MAG: protein-methionine-sulfoxide reductase catalytic subunit MsrP [Candidatus Acidiferrales bacterium]